VLYPGVFFPRINVKVSDLMKYLQTVLDEAGDIPVVVQPRQAHAHRLETPEVYDRARYWDERALKREKAVVIK